MPRWLHVKVHDGREQGYGEDHVWGSFVAPNPHGPMSTPSDGPFPTTSGAVQVHK